jgi:hypothetical protein
MAERHSSKPASIPNIRIFGNAGVPLAGLRLRPLSWSWRAAARLHGCDGSSTGYRWGNSAPLVWMIIRSTGLQNRREFRDV